MTTYTEKTENGESNLNNYLQVIELSLSKSLNKLIKVFKLINLKQLPARK